MQDLRELYANEVIEGMDLKTLMQYAYDALYDALQDMTDKDLENLVSEQYPHLLEA